MSNPWSDGRYALAGISVLLCVVAGVAAQAGLSANFWFPIGLLTAAFLVVWGVEGDGLGYLLGLMLLLAMLAYALVMS